MKRMGWAVCIGLSLLGIGWLALRPDSPEVVAHDAFDALVERDATRLLGRMMDLEAQETGANPQTVQALLDDVLWPRLDGFGPVDEPVFRQTPDPHKHEISQTWSHPDGREVGFHLVVANTDQGYRAVHVVYSVVLVAMQVGRDPNEPFEGPTKAIVWSKELVEVLPDARATGLTGVFRAREPMSMTWSELETHHADMARQARRELNAPVSSG